jgi:hypothetical protein
VFTPAAIRASDRYLSRVDGDENPHRLTVTLRSGLLEEPDAAANVRLGPFAADVHAAEVVPALGVSGASAARVPTERLRWILKICGVDGPKAMASLRIAASRAHLDAPVIEGSHPAANGRLGGPLPPMRL